MPSNDLRITIHMVSSLDGMIAKPDNSVGWFETSSPYEKGEAGENPEEFAKTIDCYLMGSKTYELAEYLAKDYGWPYGDKPTIVLTQRNFPKLRDSVEFYDGSLKGLVEKKLSLKFKNVWAVGGAALTKSLLQQNLAHEIRVLILPIILGAGLPYFDAIGREQPLRLKNSIAYKNGMVELCYEIPR